MKRLILDHFRRWWWVLGLAGLLEFWIGWLIASRPRDPFEFWAFALSLWSGANLLSFDFRRGALGPVATLPLTNRQIGYSWWLVTVPLPAMILAGMLFLGAVVCGQFRPDQALPAARLTLASLFTLAWLGSGFPLASNATRGPGGSRWGRIADAGLKMLATLMLFGSLLFAQGAANNLFKTVLLLGVGGFLTLVGWLDARGFDIGRGVQFYRGRPESAALRLARFRFTRREAKVPASQHPPLPGYGGMSFFILSRVVRVFMIIAAMSGLTALLWAWLGSSFPGHAAVMIFAGTGSLMSCGVVLIFQLLPFLRELRLLRTLPISGFGLSSALLAIVLLPLLALGAVSAAVAGWVLGTPAALTLLSNYTFVLAPASLCGFLAVWLGEGKLAYVALVVVLIGSQQVQLQLPRFLHLQELPLSLAVPVGAAGICLALLLTSWALGSTSHGYRAQGMASGSFPFGLGGE